uniref:Cytochrome b-c1 complex subunit 8 n=1 Tax=Sinocyclocheilus grahami TaxID=75366 RepID=A0A672NKZ8_SINGR
MSKCSEISFRGAIGRHFGDLAKIRHVISYSIPPFEQRAFPNYVSEGIPNVWIRFITSVAPLTVLMYLTYTWGSRKIIVKNGFLTCCQLSRRFSFVV